MSPVASCSVVGFCPHLLTSEGGGLAIEASRKGMVTLVRLHGHTPAISVDEIKNTMIAKQISNSY